MEKGNSWLKWVGHLWQSDLLFLGDMLEKCWSSGLGLGLGLGFPVITWSSVLAPLKSWPMAYYRKGRTTPHLRLASRNPALGWHSQCCEYSLQNGNGGVITTLTMGIGKLTYGLSLSSRLGGVSGDLLFDGRHSCTEDSFTGHPGLYCGDLLAVLVYMCALLEYWYT